jgi:hypothetical protein
MPNGGATVIELLASAGGIWAVPYRNRRRLAPVKLADGAIVETPTADQLRQAPEGDIANLGIDAEGRAHNNRGVYDAYPVEVFIGLTGRYLLPSGDVAAVYGAKAVPLDGRADLSGT